MKRVLNKKLYSALILLLLSNMTIALESEYKNSLTKIELIKTKDGAYSVNLHTQKKFSEPIRVIKKSDLNYYILLPETKNNTTQTVTNTQDIRNISTYTYKYAGTDKNIDNGYTKININTTKPVNFNINIKNATEGQVATVPLKDKIVNNQTKTVVKENKVQKKNSDFQEKKNQIVKKATNVIAPKKIEKAPKKTQDELKIEDLIQREIEKSKLEQQKDIENLPIEEIGLEEDFNNQINKDILEEIEPAEPIPEEIDTYYDTALEEPLGLKSKIQNKLEEYGLSIKDAILMLIAGFFSFFIMLFILNKKPNQTKIKCKADLIEKLDKKDGLVAKSPEKVVNKGQYFIFDKNIKQTGFVRPSSTEEKKGYELSSYDPDINTNYDKIKVESYNEKATKQNNGNSYDIIQKILKEDSLIEVDTKECKPKIQPQEQRVTKPVNVQKPRLKQKPVITEEKQPTILSNVEIAPERGFMCVSYNDNINLVGYIFDDIFPLYNFKQQKLENYDIKFRLSEKDDIDANFIVKVNNTRLIIRVTKKTMNLEVVM